MNIFYTIYFVTKSLLHEISRSTVVVYFMPLAACCSYMYCLPFLPTHVFFLKKNFFPPYYFRWCYVCFSTLVFQLQNVLGGALYGVWVGLPLVCLLSATGASLCFSLSRVFGHDLVNKYFGNRLGPIREEVSEWIVCWYGNKIISFFPSQADEWQEWDAVSSAFNEALSCHPQLAAQSCGSSTKCSSSLLLRLGTNRWVAAH